MSHESQHSLLAATPGMPPELTLPHKAIVGLIRISHALTLEQCAPTEPWAFGPVVNVIAEVWKLERPIAHGGALYVWKISPEALDMIHAQLSVATRLVNDVSHLPGSGASGSGASGSSASGSGSSTSGGVGAIGYLPLPALAVSQRLQNHVNKRHQTRKVRGEGSITFSKFRLYGTSYNSN